jgi:hypothetical protein
MGPPETKVWNSPFSPQGSTPGRQVGEKLLVVGSSGEGGVQDARVDAYQGRLEARLEEPVSLLLHSATNLIRALRSRPAISLWSRSTWSRYIETDIGNGEIEYEPAFAW